MSRLLSAGFSRLKKSKCFRGFMIFMFLFGGYLKIAEFYNQEKYNTSIPLDSGLFVYVTVIGILLAAFISLFIGTEYNDGTIRNKLVIGHTRSAIYLSNLIVCLAAGLLMCLSFLCASLLIGIPLLGPFSINVQNIAVMVLVSFMMSFAFTGLLTLTAMICQSRAVTAVINILAVFFLLLVSMVITSGVSAISMRFSEMLFSFATRRISASLPVSRMSISSSFTASAQPFKISKGALSPPKASTIIFIAITSCRSRGYYFVLLIFYICFRNASKLCNERSENAA